MKEEYLLTGAPEPPMSGTPIAKKILGSSSANPIDASLAPISFGDAYQSLRRRRHYHPETARAAALIRRMHEANSQARPALHLGTGTPRREFPVG